MQGAQTVHLWTEHTSKDARPANARKACKVDPMWMKVSKNSPWVIVQQDPAKLLKRGMLLQLGSSSTQPQGLLDVILVVEVVLLVEARFGDGKSNVQDGVWPGQRLQREATNE